MFGHRKVSSSTPLRAGILIESPRRKVGFFFLFPPKWVTQWWISGGFSALHQPHPRYLHVNSTTTNPTPFPSKQILISAAAKTQNQCLLNPCPTFLQAFILYKLFFKIMVLLFFFANHPIVSIHPLASCLCVTLPNQPQFPPTHSRLIYCLRSFVVPLAQKTTIV